MFDSDIHCPKKALICSAWLNTYITSALLWHLLVTCLLGCGVHRNAFLKLHLQLNTEHAH